MAVRVVTLEFRRLDLESDSKRGEGEFEEAPNQTLKPSV